MDRIKIGKFIASCRKDKRITQEQLAEILGVTSKSVSKWQNGICLPEALLYEPLCTALEITINELFAGHRIKEEDYKRIADENLMQMLKYKLYSLSNKDITFNEFDDALTQISELTAQLKSFKTKNEAVVYLMEHTNSSFELCERVYDFYTGLFNIKQLQWFNEKTCVIPLPVQQ